jgi:hypothetical protein
MLTLWQLIAEAGCYLGILASVDRTQEAQAVISQV